MTVIINGTTGTLQNYDYLVPTTGFSYTFSTYNTHGGQHPEGRPLRKNYAGIGFTYDRTRDAFIPPKPYASWTLNDSTCLWDAPTPMPTDGVYTWDESTLSWKPV